MKTKGFMDGDRLCLVFEDATGDEIRELVAKHNVEMVEPLDAEPVKTAEDEPSSTMALIETLSEAGKPSKEKDQAFKVLSEEMTASRLTGGVRKIAATTLNGYLGVRFAGVDGEQYATKLTDEQCRKFMETFGSVTPSKAKETADIRFMVCATVKRCQKIKTA